MSEQTVVRALGIVGSPRRGGNTEVLVDHVLSGAEEAGALIEKVRLTDLEINPCRACEACHKKGHCVQQDDMATLLAKMEESDLWVLGTPVYWWGPTAQFKAYLDRWYGQSGVVTFRGRRVILTIPLGASDPSYADQLVGMLECALGYAGVDLRATILAPGVSGRGQVREHADVLAAARHAGREAIERSK